MKPDCHYSICRVDW